MKKWLTGAALLAAAILGVIVVGTAEAADVKFEIDAIMKKINGGGKKSMHNDLGAALKESKIDWDEFKKKSKVYAEYGTELAKNKEPKGDAKQWEKLSKAYSDSAKALDEATDKKDKDAAQKALAGTSKCKACHDAFKG